jgi:hypothetical protein
MWRMALPLCGMLRPAPLPHDMGSSMATVLLEEEGQPAEMVWPPLLSERTDALEITGDIHQLDDLRLLSHLGKVPHLPLEAEPQQPRAHCQAIAAGTFPWMERS